MKDITFKDFYEYILTAERDEYGYHKIENNGCFPKYSLHIYDGDRQVNVNCQMAEEDIPISIGNFIFSPEEDELTIYPVINGNCNYSCGLSFSIYNIINDQGESNLWYTWLGPKGKTIKDILVNIFNN